MDAQDIRNLQEAYLDVYQELDEALTGSRLERAKEKMQGLNLKDPRAKALKRVASSQEGSNRGDTVPGDLPRDKSNTTLPTGRGGGGLKGRGKTVNRAPYGAPLGSGTSQSDRGKGNKAARRGGREVDDTRYDESYDLYDIIFSHLLDEGYAETPEAAEVIMVNMSEDWRESIVEEVLEEGKKEFPETKVREKAAKHEEDYIKKRNPKSMRLARKMKGIASTVEVGDDPRNTMHGQDLRKIR